MRLSVLVLLLGVSGALAVAQDAPGGADEKITAAQQKQLAAMLETVRDAERVEALPVKAEAMELVGHIVEAPVAVDAATGRALGRVLTSYDWTRWSPMACGFQPAVAYRFRRGAETTVVQVCFLCGEMALDGIPGRLGDKKLLDSSQRKTFLRAARKAFPGQFTDSKE